MKHIVVGLANFSMNVEQFCSFSVCCMFFQESQHHCQFATAILLRGHSIHYIDIYIGMFLKD